VKNATSAPLNYCPLVRPLKKLHFALVINTKPILAVNLKFKQALAHPATGHQMARPNVNCLKMINTVQI